MPGVEPGRRNLRKQKASATSSRRCLAAAALGARVAALSVVLELAAPDAIIMRVLISIWRRHSRELRARSS